MPSANIQLSFPSLPEGFIGTPDDFLAWISANAQFTIGGTSLVGQVGTPPANAATDTGLYVDVSNTREIACFNPTAGAYTYLGPPVGGMMFYPVANISAPPNSNWLFCEGQSVSQTTYAALFALMGTAYGSAKSGYFNLPDMRGRVPIGADSVSPDATGNTSGNAGASPLSGPNVTVASGVLPSYSAGTYAGSITPQNVAIAPGAPNGFRLAAGSLVGSGNVTYIQPPSIVGRWLIRCF